MVDTPPDLPESSVIHYSTEWPILASGYSPSFLDRKVIAEHSLCNNLAIEMPRFTPTLVPHLHDIVSPQLNGIRLGVKILHTPGHTPDEIALYDETEMMLYVGDSLYEWEPIIFPIEGSIKTWFSSMNFLISFVNEKNEAPQIVKDGSGKPSEVMINSGHCTVFRPASDVLLSTMAYMRDVVHGRKPVTERSQKRGEETVMYGKIGDRFSLRCPERLMLEVRNIKDITDTHSNKKAF